MTCNIVRVNSMSFFCVLVPCTQYYRPSTHTLDTHFHVVATFGAEVHKRVVAYNVTPHQLPVISIAFLIFPLI